MKRIQFYHCHDWQNLLPSPKPSKSCANGPFAMISAPVAFVQGGTMTPAVSEYGMEFGGWRLKSDGNYERFWLLFSVSKGSLRVAFPPRQDSTPRIFGSPRPQFTSGWAWPCPLGSPSLCSPPCIFSLCRNIISRIMYLL